MKSDTMGILFLKLKWTAISLPHKKGAKASKRPLRASSSSPNIEGLSPTTLPKLTLGNATTSGLNSCGKVPICFGQDRKSANEICPLHYRIVVHARLSILRKNVVPHDLI